MKGETVSKGDEWGCSGLVMGGCVIVEGFLWARRKCRDDALQKAAWRGSKSESRRTHRHWKHLTEPRTIMQEVSGCLSFFCLFQNEWISEQVYLLVWKSMTIVAKWKWSSLTTPIVVRKPRKRNSLAFFRVGHTRTEVTGSGVIRCLALLVRQNHWAAWNRYGITYYS